MSIVPLQDRFNAELWLPLLAALELAAGSAALTSAVRLCSAEYLPEVDIKAIRQVCLPCLVPVLL